MREHVWHGPADHADSDEADRCQACVLSLCKVCNGAEASLPAECPGRKMTTEGTLDFKDGEWRHA